MRPSPISRRPRSVVAITGASSGIGRATALALAREGKALVLLARREEALASLVTACERLGAPALGLPVDVTDAAAVRGATERALEHFGGLDAWVSNAGVFCFGELQDIPDDAFRRVLEVNVMGYVHGAKAVLPLFRRQGFGTLVHVASVYGRIAGPYASPYVASKFAVRGFTESLRAELRGTGIHVCMVSPLAVDTPLWDHAANFSGWQPWPMPPVFAPQGVARAISRCLRRPRREVVVGAGGRMVGVLNALAPGLVEALMRRAADRFQFGPKPAAASPGNLFAPMDVGTDLIATEADWRSHPSRFARTVRAPPQARQGLWPGAPGGCSPARSPAAQARIRGSFRLDAAENSRPQFSGTCR